MSKKTISELPIDFQRKTPLKTTGSTVFYCEQCFAPVVDSQLGREGHQYRLGHWPQERRA